jgi:hypothetical protein
MLTLSDLKVGDKVTVRGSFAGITGIFPVTRTTKTQLEAGGRKWIIRNARPVGSGKDSWYTGVRIEVWRPEHDLELQRARWLAAVENFKGWKRMTDVQLSRVVEVIDQYKREKENDADQTDYS